MHSGSFQSTKHWLKRWFGALDQELLAGLLLLLISAWVFLLMADQIGEPTAADVDEHLLLALRNPRNLADPVGSRYFEGAVRDITALGSSPIAILISIAVLGYLLLVRRPRMALFVAAAIGGGGLIGELLKGVFMRERPSVVPHLVHVSSASFPSGHATTATVVYLTLAALVARTTKSRVIQAYIMSLAIFIALAVGFSRVYLGVHYPRDVIAGWSVGTCWALICGLTARFLQRKHQVEPATNNASQPAKPTESNS